MLPDTDTVNCPRCGSLAVPTSSGRWICGLDCSPEYTIAVPEPLECDHCGADLEVGVDHDCPVGGNIVRIDRVTKGLDESQAGDS